MWKTALGAGLLKSSAILASLVLKLCAGYMRMEDQTVKMI